MEERTSIALFTLSCKQELAERLGRRGKAQTLCAACQVIDLQSNGQQLKRATDTSAWEAGNLLAFHGVTRRCFGRCVE